MSRARFDRVSALAGNEAVAHHPGTPTVRRIVELEAERDKARADCAELRQVLLQTADALEAAEAYDDERSGRYNEPPGPELDAARALLAKLDAEDQP